MAGSYPDVPALRIPYDRDGSVGFNIDSLNVVYVMTAGDLVAMNNESATTYYSSQGTSGLGAANYYGVIFPELHDLRGYFIDWANNSGGQILDLYSSADTTNGLDGTWTLITATPTAGTTLPGYRSAIQSVTANGIKAVRILLSSNGGAPYPLVKSFHLYGAMTAGQTPNRLRLWHPTLNQEVDGAYFDWGDVATTSTADRTFRVKNNSASITANTIAVSLEALTDTTPTVLGQHTLSDGGAFGSSVTIASLAPGAISGTLTLRRTTPSNAIMSVWTVRIVASSADLP